MGVGTPVTKSRTLTRPWKARSNTKPVLGQNRESTYKFLTVTLQRLHEQLLPLVHWNARQSKQENSMEREPLSEHHLPKTLIARDQNCFLLIGQLQYLIVLGPRFDFRHVEHVVTSVP